MTVEMANVLMANGGSKITRTKAEECVHLMLEKQMAFYAQMADAEVDTSGQDAAMAIAELPGRADAVIRQGAAMADHMTPDARRNWQNAAERLRETCRKLVELL